MSIQRISIRDLGFGSPFDQTPSKHYQPRRNLLGASPRKPKGMASINLGEGPAWRFAIIYLLGTREAAEFW
jgi:hypothetical protein